MSGADGIILFLPPDEGDEPSWTRVVAGEVVERGTGTGWTRESAGEARRPAGCAMLVAPAGIVNLHWIELPDLPPRQGQAVAKIRAIEGSIGPAAALHVAVAPADDADGCHVAAVVDRAWMAQWLDWARGEGIDPDIILPAPLLLPEPGEGFARGDVGGQTVLRGSGCALAAADPIAPAIVGESAISDVAAEEVDRAAAMALERPPLNLLQGDYARRKRSLPDRRALSRMAATAALIGLMSLLIPLVLTFKYDFAADAADRESVALARTVLPAVADAASAPAHLDARLADMGGGDAFSACLAGVLAALRDRSRVSLSAMDYLADGSLRATLKAARAGEFDDVVSALRKAGFAVTAAPRQGQGGEAQSDVMVRLP